MKYKVLLTGGNVSAVDTFFAHMGDIFELQYCSVRFEDIVSHLQYFQPDIFVYCMEEESPETIRQMVLVKGQLGQRKLPFAVLGGQEECDRFLIKETGTADLIVKGLVSAASIREKFLAFLKEVEWGRKTEKEKKFVEEEKKRIAEEKIQAVAEHEYGFAAAAKKRRKHILVIDDDVRMLKAIKEQLHEQYDVATAINGKFAFRFLEKKHTDLILLDYVMPEGDGPSVLKKLHENPVTKEIPVIFLTGMTEQEKIREALSEKPEGYLLKPVEREILLTTIHSVLH